MMGRLEFKAGENNKADEFVDEESSTHLRSSASSASASRSISTSWICV